MAVWINPDWAGIEAGTKAQPYAGIDSMIASVGWSLGETYYLKAGTTDTLAVGAVIQVNNVTILPYTDDRDDFYVPFLRPVITVVGDINTIAVGGTPAGLVTGFTIRGIDVKGSSGTIGRCIYILSADLADSSDVADAHIEDCTVREGGLQNIRVYASSVKILACEIYDADTDNIFISGGNDLTIEDNIIYGSGRGGVQADGIQMVENAAPAANCDRTIIRRNDITNDSGLKHCLIGPCAASVDSFIEDNVFNAVNCLIGVTVNGIGTKFRRNKIIATVASKYIASILDGQGTNIEWTFNKIIGLSPSSDLAFNTMLYVNADNNIIANNVFKSTGYQQYYSAIGMPLSITSGNESVNNIIDGTDIGVRQHSTQPNTEHYNKYKNITLYNHADGATTPAEMATTNEVTKEDDLDSDLRPGSNSELQGTGIHLSIKYRDFQGRRLKIPPAVGVYEFTGRVPVRKI